MWFWQTIQDKNKRILLNFRPDDPYCKPVYGDRIPTACLVLKIRRRKKKSANASNNNEKNELINSQKTISGKIIAIVETNITFNCKFLSKYSTGNDH